MSIRVVIADEGAGFAPPSGLQASGSHWGLRGMRKRAELIGGTLTL